MKLLKNNLLKLISIIAISGAGLVSTSAQAQRSGHGIGQHASQQDSRLELNRDLNG